MSKIGVITLDGNFNYGNRLQNYALSEYLKKMGHEVDNIVLNKNHTEHIQYIKYIINMILRRQTSIDFYRMTKAKTIKIKPFTDEYLNNVYLKDINTKDYTLFIVGSDQVWNPNIIDKNVNYFLQFASENKRMSYSASFGVSELPEEQILFYKNMLKGMKKISVRESDGQKIIHDLIDRECPVVLDPTMLLTNEEWLTVCDNVSYSVLDSKKPYIMIYLLRKYPDSLLEKIRIFAKENNFIVFEVMGDFYDKNKTICNPIEFIKVIKEAKMVFSDSFHCGVFSIIMHTPFVLFERSDGNMGSRITTLLKTYGLEKHKYSNDTNFEFLMKNSDFKEVDEIMYKERLKSIEYLNSSIRELELKNDRN